MAQAFSRSPTTEKPGNAVRSEAQTTLTAPLNRWGYRLTTQSDTALTYERTYRPWYVWLIGLLLIPALLGIVLLIFWTETDTITLMLDEQPDETTVVIQGEAPGKVREAFERLQL